MKKIKIFYAKQMTSDLNKDDTISLMNVEVNAAIANWVKNDNIVDYEIINSQLTATPELNLFGNFYASSIILNTHISYEEK